LVVKRPDQLRIDPDLLNQVAEFAEAKDLMLIGQIHSHPGTYVDLSPTDLHYGISAPHFLSVVAPHYAQDPGVGWPQCGVHVFLPKEGFQRLSVRQIERRIRRARGGKPALTRLGE
jgi:proteasome lid subunit RPN8/RPN11